MQLNYKLVFIIIRIFEVFFKKKISLSFNSIGINIIVNARRHEFECAFISNFRHYIEKNRYDRNYDDSCNKIFTL